MPCTSLSWCLVSFGITKPESGHDRRTSHLCVLSGGFISTPAVTVTATVTEYLIWQQSAAFAVRVAKEFHAFYHQCFLCVVNLFSTIGVPVVYHGFSSDT